MLFKKVYLTALVLSILMVSSCATEQSFDWDQDRKEYPERYETYYQELEKLPLEKRSLELSLQLKNRIKFKLEDLNPKIAIEAAEDINNKNQILSKELEKIPLKLKKIIEKRVIGWTIVKGLEISGTTIPVYARDNRTRKSIVIINENFLTLSLDDFTKFLENTVYKEGDYQIGIKTNKEISALLYLFLHESGHALGIKNNLNLDYEDSEYLKFSIDKTPFTRSTWQPNSEKNKAISKNKDMEYWPLMRKYYVANQDNKLENTLMYSHFKDYMNSEFSTMYSASSMYEDWADTFTQVMLEKYFKVNIEYFITQNKKEILKYRPCHNEICTFKKKAIELFLEYPEMYLEEE